MKQRTLFRLMVMASILFFLHLGTAGAVIQDNRSDEESPPFFIDPTQISTVSGTDMTFSCSVAAVSFRDSRGNYAGLNEEGDLVNTIPELDYRIINKTITTYIPVGVDLQVEISGYDNGTMNILFIDYSKEGPVTANTLHDVSIMDGTRLSFAFNAVVKDKADISIWYDFHGDGKTKVLHLNQQIPFSQLMNDTVAPVSTAAVGVIQYNGAAGGKAVVSLSATDTASGISWIAYQVDGGPMTEYTAPFVIKGEGSHEISYYAMDDHGNVEENQTRTIHIDPRSMISDSPYKTMERDLTILFLRLLIGLQP